MEVDRYDQMSTQALEDHLSNRLVKEIADLKDTLVKIDNNGQSVDIVSEIVKRISSILQTFLDRKLHIWDNVYKKPLHDLLCVKPLTRTEIPLDLIDIFISAGYDVNTYAQYGRTSLDYAFANCHYNAVRLLVKHGARCNTVISTLFSLASRPNVPLDMFDLLATPQNLNTNCHSSRRLPLHKAVSCGHTATALHLIKLGASVNQQDRWSKLPVEYFVESRKISFTNEFFMRILPSSAHGRDILSPIYKLLSKEKPDKTCTHLLDMLRQLLQRLHFKCLKVQIVHHGSRQYMLINGVRIIPHISIGESLLAAYLCSLILVELEFNIVVTPNEVADKLKRLVAKRELTYPASKVTSLRRRIDDEIGHGDVT